MLIIPTLKDPRDWLLKFGMAASIPFYVFEDFFTFP